VSAVVVGAGPAGLMAAEAIAAAGHRVTVCDASASAGRKFLLAGRGGLNLTHVEPRPGFDARYGAAAPRVGHWLDVFGPDALRAWVHELGIETFVGTSGRVFPAEMKAAPLLRRWLHRLRGAGVEFRSRHRWAGWSDDGMPRFMTPSGEIRLSADVLVLAMGGASWPRLGSDGAWVPLLAGRGIAIEPLVPANCGFDAAWSASFAERFAGHPLRTVVMSPDADAEPTARRWTRGEAVVTATGVEGGLVYALAPALRQRIAAQGTATVLVDLLPDRSEAAIAELLARPAGGRSLANRLRARLRLDGVKAGLLREGVSMETLQDPARLAARIKALPVKLLAPRPIDEAISTAGGVRLDELDERLMLRRLPGVFCAGEMLDWEAPTGGYLLTACFASGRIAGVGAAAALEAR
jgi:uncharacterized flavoprotein (TIGR03862 family)